MHFVKMHGIGNDYVYINGFSDHDAVSAACDPALLARRIADRHTGVGGDGLILVLPPDPGVDADVRMRMFNADGSEAEMCGNGIRCVAKLAHDHGISTARPMKVQTASDVLLLDYRLNGDDKVDSVTVDMVVSTLTQNAKTAQEVIAGVVARLPYVRTCECASALKYAILTRPDAISDQVKKDLAPLIGHYVEVSQ